VLTAAAGTFSPADVGRYVVAGSGVAADTYVTGVNDAGTMAVLSKATSGAVTSASVQTSNAVPTGAYNVVVVSDADPAVLDPDTDVVVTDHHRDELGPVLRDVLVGKPRWIGVMGNPRHQGPHVEALAALGVPAADVARVHRPIGLNIGSRTPPEIALSALAGLLADRNDRPGGFHFPTPA